MSAIFSVPMRLYLVHLLIFAHCLFLDYLFASPWELESSFLHARSSGEWPKILPSPSKYKKAHLLLAVVLNISLKSRPLNFSADDRFMETLMSFSIERNKKEVLKKLFSLFNIKLLSFETFKSSFLIASRKYGHCGVIEFLANKCVFIKDIGPNTTDDQIAQYKRNAKEMQDLLVLACKDGDKNLVKSLLLFVYPAIRIVVILNHQNAFEYSLVDLFVERKLPVWIVSREEQKKLIVLLMKKAAMKDDKWFKTIDEVYDIFANGEISKDCEEKGEKRQYLPKPISSLSSVLLLLHQNEFERLIMTRAKKQPHLVYSIIIESVACIKSCSCRFKNDFESFGNSSQGHTLKCLHESLVKHVTFMKKSTSAPISLLPFMVACQAGFEDIVDEYIEDRRILDFSNLYELNENCLELAASANGKLGIVIKLLYFFGIEKSSLSTALKTAAANGKLDIVKYLIDKTGADPISSKERQSNYPFIVACSEGHSDVIWYLVNIAKVRDHALTPDKFFLHLLECGNLGSIRKVFLGPNPVLSISSAKFFQYAYQRKRFKSLAAFFDDTELMTWLFQVSDASRVINFILADAALKNNTVVINAYLKNLNSFPLKISNHILMIYAKSECWKTVGTLFKNPRRSKRDTYKLLIRLLKIRSHPSYLIDVLTENDLADPVLKSHLKYYLPSEILQKMFPAEVDWKSDDFLRAVQNCPLEGGPTNFERFFVNLFFDKSLGLFGSVSHNDLTGGSRAYDRYFIRLINDMEMSGRLTPSRGLENLKKHLTQVASVMLPVQAGLEFDMRFDRELLVKHLRDLPESETYLLSVRSREFRDKQRTGHIMFALVEKENDKGILDVKVFNSRHRETKSRDIVPLEYPYMSWWYIPLEEFSVNCPELFYSHKVILSEVEWPVCPRNIPRHMLMKGQLAGTCSGYKFWLIAKHDLETLPAFLEFSVALHLFFIENLAENLKDGNNDTIKMSPFDVEWKPTFQRAWLAVTKTPHFEYQLLKDIEDIKEGSPDMYRKLRLQIIESVQRRYHLQDENSAIDCIQWKDKVIDRLLYEPVVADSVSIPSNENFALDCIQSKDNVVTGTLFLESFVTDFAKILPDKNSANKSIQSKDKVINKQSEPVVTTTAATLSNGNSANKSIQSKDKVINKQSEPVVTNTAATPSNGNSANKSIQSKDKVINQQSEPVITNTAATPSNGNYANKSAVTNTAATPSDGNSAIDCTKSKDRGKLLLNPVASAAFEEIISSIIVVCFLYFFITFFTSS